MTRAPGGAFRLPPRSGGGVYMWHTLKSLDFDNFIEAVSMVISSLPPSFVILVTGGLVVLCALAVKRVLF